MELSSLVSWLGTFEDIHVSTASPVLLCDGVVLQKVMMQIYPDSKAELSKSLAEPVQDAWLWRFTNIKRVIRAVRDFDAQGRDALSSEQLPNALAIAKDGDLEELRKLISLLLSCAVQCDDKETFVGRILAMDDSLQKALMHSIEQIQNRPATAAADAETALVHQFDREAKELTLALSAIRSEYDDLQALHNRTSDQKSELEREVTQLKLQLLQQGGDNSADRVLKLEVTRLTQEVERMTNELVEATEESQRKDIKLASLSRQAEKVDEITRRASDLRDELDMALAENQSLKKFEAACSKLRARLEVAEVAEQRLMTVQEENGRLTAEVVRLGDMVAETVVLRSKMKLSETRVSLLESENARIQRERDDLEMRLLKSPTRQSHDGPQDDMHSLASPLVSGELRESGNGSATESWQAATSLSLEMDKDRISQLLKSVNSLEKANAQLKQQNDELKALGAANQGSTDRPSNGDSAPSVNPDVQGLRDTVATLTESNRLLQAKVAELQADVSRGSLDKEEVSRLRDRHQKEIAELEDEIKSWRDQVDALTREAKQLRRTSDESSRTVAELQEELVTRTADYELSERKLKARRDELASAKAQLQELQQEVENSSQERHKLETSLVDVQLQLRQAKSLQQASAAVSDAAATSKDEDALRALLEASQVSLREREAELSQLRSDIRLEVSSAEAAQQRMARELAAVSAELTKIKEELAEAERARDEFSATAVRLQREAKPRAAELTRLRARVDELEAERDTLADGKRALERSLHDSERLLSQSKDDCASLEQRIEVERQAAAKETAAVKETMEATMADRLDAAAKDAASRLELAAKELSATKDASARELAAIKEAAERELAIYKEASAKELAAEKQASEREIAVLRESAERAARTVEELSEAKEALAKAAALARADADTALARQRSATYVDSETRPSPTEAAADSSHDASLLNAKIFDLQVALNASQKEVEQLKQENAALQAELAELRKELVIANGARSQVEQLLSVSETALRIETAAKESLRVQHDAQLESLRAQQEAQVRIMRAEADSTTRQQIEQLQSTAEAQVRSVRAEMEEQMKERIQGMKDKIDVQETLLREREERLADQRAQLDEYRSSAAAAAAKRLRSVKRSDSAAALGDSVRSASQSQLLASPSTTSESAAAPASTASPAPKPVSKSLPAADLAAASASVQETEGGADMRPRSVSARAPPPRVIDFFDLLEQVQGRTMDDQSYVAKPFDAASQASSIERPPSEAEEKKGGLLRSFSKRVRSIRVSKKKEGVDSDASSK